MGKIDLKSQVVCMLWLHYGCIVWISRLLMHIFFTMVDLPSVSIIWFPHSFDCSLPAFEKVLLTHTSFSCDVLSSCPLTSDLLMQINIFMQLFFVHSGMIIVENCCLSRKLQYSAAFAVGSSWAQSQPVWCVSWDRWSCLLFMLGFITSQSGNHFSKLLATSSQEWHPFEICVILWSIRWFGVSFWRIQMRIRFFNAELIRDLLCFFSFLDVFTSEI